MVDLVALAAGFLASFHCASFSGWHFETMESLTYLGSKGEGGCKARPSMTHMLEGATTEPPAAPRPRYVPQNPMHAPHITVEQIPQQIEDIKKQIDRRKLELPILEQVADLHDELEAANLAYKSHLPIDYQQPEVRQQNLDESKALVDQLRNKIVAVGGLTRLGWVRGNARNILRQTVEVQELAYKRIEMMDSEPYRVALKARWRQWDERQPALRADGSGRPGYYRVYDKNTGLALSMSLSDYDIRRDYPQLAGELQPDSSD